VRCRTRTDTRFDAAATLAIGADGMHSTIAKLTGAQEYRARPPLMGTYWAYFSDVPIDRIELYIRDGRASYGWPTNDGLSLVGVNWTAADYPAVRGDIPGEFHKVLRNASPDLAERVRDDRRKTRFIGGSIPNCFRTPFGPGWARVATPATRRIRAPHKASPMR
jgi:2-polyprenyl-6-methoxyphenol hydroxylase-like FAD-dependent oxidoreductase